MGKEQFCERVAFGTAAISGDGGGYGFGKIEEKQAQSLLNCAYENGLRLFDTAPIYGFGLAEERLGRAFSGGRRSKVQIISKAGVDWHRSGVQKNRVNMSNDPRLIERMLDESLTRLKSDYIDVYMLHWPDRKVPVELSLEVLLEAKLKGKIRKIGYSNPDLLELKKACAFCEIDVVQVECNFFNTAALDSIQFFSLSNNIEIQSWGSLDKGILSGRAIKGRSYDSCDARAWAPWWKKRNNNKRMEFVGKLKKEVLEENSITLLQFASHYISHKLQKGHSLYGLRTKEDLYALKKAIEAPSPPVELFVRAEEMWKELSGL